MAQCTKCGKHVTNKYDSHECSNGIIATVFEVLEDVFDLSTSFVEDVVDSVADAFDD